MLFVIYSANIQSACGGCSIRFTVCCIRFTDGLLNLLLIKNESKNYKNPIFLIRCYLINVALNDIDLTYHQFVILAGIHWLKQDNKIVNQVQLINFTKMEPLFVCCDYGFCYGLFYVLNLKLGKQQSN